MRLELFGAVERSTSYADIKRSQDLPVQYHHTFYDLLA